MEKDSVELTNPLLAVHRINEDHSEHEDEHHDHVGHEGHTQLEDFVLPPLSEDQVKIANDLIKKKYPLRKMRVYDVIPCCCCAKMCRNDKAGGDVKLIEQSAVEDIDDLDLDQLDRMDLVEAQEMNERLEKAIRDCGGEPYVGDDIIASKKK